MALAHLTWVLVVMLERRDMLAHGSIRVAVITTRRIAMLVAAITAVLAITTAVLPTPMGDQVIRITAIIHPGHLRHMDTTRIRITGAIPIHTIAVILTLIRTTKEDMVTTLQLWQQCSVVWASSATITA